MGSWERERKIGKEEPRKEDWRETEKVLRHYKKKFTVSSDSKGIQRILSCRNSQNLGSCYQMSLCVS